MERLLMKELRRWKESPYRKPLILWGARQVGKTWLMRAFGSACYSQTVYISFYNNRRIASLFDADYSAHRIIEALEIDLHVQIEPGNTLLIFDEVITGFRIALGGACEYYGIRLITSSPPVLCLGSPFTRIFPFPSARSMSCGFTRSVFRNTCWPGEK